MFEVITTYKRGENYDLDVYDFYPTVGLARFAARVAIQHPEVCKVEIIYPKPEKE